MTVNATDAYWNPVPASDTVAITSSDPLALLPPNAPLVGGTATYAVTLESSGTATDHRH